ncbi:MAG: recombination regulator RecX [Marinobacter sp.]|nr:recombination regulator RecX [Marinobacter sp.]
MRDRSQPGAEADPLEQARTTAMRLLARREHSRFELARKLRQRRLPGEVIDRVLDEFEAEQWLSDERFAEVYAEQRRGQGYGPLRILADLQQRGIRQLPSAVRALDTAAWVEQAVQLRERRFGLTDLADDWQERARQARFLSQRGYSGEQVERALGVTADRL